MKLFEYLTDKAKNGLPQDGTIQKLNSDFPLNRFLNLH